MSNPSRSLAAKQRRRLQKPIWLRFLLFVQHGSSVLAFGSISITLSVYAGVVYSQQQWSRHYEELQKLQRDQRDLITANETLKNQLAEQAENPDAGLVSPTSANTLVLPSLSSENFLKPKKPSQKEQTESQVTAPMGY